MKKYKENMKLKVEINMKINDYRNIILKRKLIQCSNLYMVNF